MAGTADKASRVCLPLLAGCNCISVCSDVADAANDGGHAAGVAAAVAKAERAEAEAAATLYIKASFSNQIEYFLS